MFHLSVGGGRRLLVCIGGSAPAAATGGAVPSVGSAALERRPQCAHCAELCLGSASAAVERRSVSTVLCRADL